jgi:uncharacterized protein YyaL (SSP411 family)
MLNLIRLSRLTGNHELEEQAAAISRVFAGSIRRSPAGHAQFMIAMGFLTHSAYEIVIAGRPGAEDTEEMLREIGRQYLPNTVVLLRPPEELSSDIVSVAPFTKDLKPIGDTATAYVCTNFTCHSPTTDSDEMLRLLNLRKT